MGNVDPDLPVRGQWRGWTFFRLRESPQVGASSSGVPRLQPDVIQRNPPEVEQPWTPPKQVGVSSSSLRRGQVTASERGRLAMESIQANRPTGPLTSRVSGACWNSESWLLWCNGIGAEGSVGGGAAYIVLYQPVQAPRWRVCRGFNTFHVGKPLQELSLSQGEHSFDEADTTAKQMGGWTHDFHQRG